MNVFVKTFHINFITNNILEGRERETTLLKNKVLLTTLVSWSKDTAYKINQMIITENELNNIDNKNKGKNSLAKSYKYGGEAS